MKPQINAGERRLDFTHQELTGKIIKVFYAVYNELGYGFLEAVYEKAFVLALREEGLSVETQVEIKVWFRGQEIGTFFADVLVNGVVLLELKAARALDSSHEAQTLNYLRATDIEIALLFNFGPKPEFKRLSFDNRRKQNHPRHSEGSLIDALLE